MTKTAEHHEPFFLQWHLTDRCNLRCSHCYGDHITTRELGLAEAREVVDRFAAFVRGMGSRGSVHLTGGEPLLRADLFVIVRVIRSSGLGVRLMSNGTLIDEAVGERLRAYGVRVVQVSVDGDPETHDAIRGEGSHAAVMSGIRALGRVGMTVTVSMTVHRRNLHAIEAVARDAARAGARRLHLARHVPCGRGAALADELLDAAEWRRARRRVLRAARRHRLELPLRDPTWIEAGADPPVGVGCAVGYSGLALGADGTLYPCRRLPISLGNVLEQDLSEVWAGPLLSRLRDRDALLGRCGRCPARWRCGGCRAVAAAVNGSPLAEDPQCDGPGRRRPVRGRLRSLLRDTLTR